METQSHLFSILPQRVSQFLEGIIQSNTWRYKAAKYLQIRCNRNVESLVRTLPTKMKIDRGGRNGTTVTTVGANDEFKRK